MTPLSKDVILASAKAQGFTIGHTGHWWVEDERRLASPLGILARHAGVSLPDPCGRGDPVFAWCAKQWGHHVVEAFLRGFEGEVSRARLCCVSQHDFIDYAAAYRIAQELRDDYRSK